MSPKPVRADERARTPEAPVLTPAQRQAMRDAARHRTARECHGLIEAMCAHTWPAQRR